MEHARVKAGQAIKQTTSKLSAVKQKGTNPKWQPNNSCPIKRMKRNLQIRNLMPMVTTVAMKSKSIRLNKPMIMKNMRP